MAFADVSFLLSILPHSLANYSTFALNYTFRFVYFHAKHELIALANWSSTVAIWLVLIVCVDRLLGIRSPLHSHKEWTARKTCLLLLGIVVGTGLLTSFHHVSHQCYYWSLCNGTQVHSKCFSVVGDTWRKNETNPTPQWVRNYVRTGTTLHALFGIIFPTIALIALNVALVRELKKRYNQPLLPSEEPFLCRSIYKPNDDCVQRRQERRVTVTVCAIVCCFILTQGPSSLLLLWNMFGNGFSKVTNPTLYDMSRAVNFLTAIGKSTNFFLFCFISASFRRRLTQLLVKKRRQSTVLSHFREFSSRRRKSSTRKSTKS
uniref:G-protein coupled receptors family 1 profile domain-containing protein n=1 Tax=Plectus sambesii TaxID=2011161 RepID=A0A914X1C9_9BILA